MNRLKRGISASLLLVFIVMLSSCKEDIKITKGLDKDTGFVIMNRETSMSLLKLLLANEVNKYEDLLGIEALKKEDSKDNIIKDLKNEIKARMTELSSISLLAKNNMISLTKEELTTLNEQAKKYYDQLSKNDKTITGIKLKDIETLYQDFLLSEKYYDSLFEQYDEEISDEESRVISVNYIFIKGKNDTSKKKANDILNSIKNGSDFLTLSKEESDDENNTLEFGRGKMLKEFEEASFKLKKGDISDVIETKKGYFIVKCMEEYLVKETEDYKDELIKEAKKKIFLEKYNEFIKNKNLQFNNKVWDDVSLEYIISTDTKSLDEFYTKKSGS